MDRTSLRRLRAQPGYLPFVSAATLARVSDEMFSVGVVLLVLDRTGSASLAGLAVAAITLPSLISGPLLGAWLDLTGRRRSLMVLDQLLISTMLVVLVLVAGNTPDWVIPLTVLMAGLTYPLSFGGFTSFIPVLVPDDLLAPANALEATSFNSALVVGPALAGGLSGAFGPETSLLVEAGLALLALVLILRIPDLDREGRRGEGTLLGVAAAGIRQIVSIPELRGITAAAAIGLGGLGLMTVTFPLFAVEHLDGERSDAGFMWAAFAAGSTIGALSLVRLQRRVPPARIVLARLCGLRRAHADLAAGRLAARADAADRRRRARGRAGAGGQVRRPPAGRAAVALRAGVHDGGRPQGRLVRHGRSVWRDRWRPASARRRRCWSRRRPRSQPPSSA